MGKIKNTKLLNYIEDDRNVYIIISLVGFVLYFTSLFNVLTFRVNVWPNSGASVLSSNFFYELFFTAKIFDSPSLGLAYIPDYLLWGYSPVGTHLLTVLLHVIASVLVFILAKNFFEKKWAFFASIVFLVHPAHSDAVSSASARGEIVATILLLVALQYFLKRENKYSFHCAGLIFISSLFSLAALAVPLLMFVYIVLYEEKKNLVRIVPSLFVVLLMLFGKLFVDLSRHIHVYGADFFEKTLTNIKIFGIYVKTAFFPFDLNAYYSFPLVDDFFIFSVVVPLQFLVLLVILTSIALQNNKEASLFLLWFVLSLLPFLHFIPQSVFLSESSLYFSIVALSLFLAKLLKSAYEFTSKEKIIYVRVFVVILACLSIIIVLNRSYKWREDYTILADTVLKSPDSALIHYNLAVAYDDKEYYDLALKEYEEAIRLSPRLAIAYYNASRLYVMTGDHDLGMKALKWALAYGFNNVAMLVKDSAFTELHKDEEFVEIVRNARSGARPH